MSKLKIAFLLLAVLLAPLRLDAVEKKVLLEEVPFSPCNMQDLIVFNSSMLEKQISGVKRGEMVNVLAWTAGGRDVLVGLRDGSRGYMPAISFLSDEAFVKVNGQEYKACVFYEMKQEARPRYQFPLPNGLYRIVDVWWWGYRKDSMAPIFWVAQDASSGKKYYVSNDVATPSYSLFNISALTSGDLKDLPREEIAKKTIFFDDGKNHTIERYVGYRREDLEKVFGAPDTWISASRSKDNLTELFYRNICFVDEMGDKRNVIMGAVFYVGADGKVKKTSVDSYRTVPRKKVSFVKVPAPGASVGKPGGESVDFDMRWNDFYETVTHALDFGKWMTILEVVILTLLLMALQWGLLRAGWKKGKNSAVVVTTYLFVVLPAVFFTSVFLETSSRLINVVNILLPFVLTLGIYPWKQITNFRCERCGKYVPKDKYYKKTVGPVMLGKYTQDVRVAKGTRYDYKQLDRTFYREWKTHYEDWETQLHKYHYRKCKYFKRCPGCSYEWTYEEPEYLDHNYEVLNRYTKESTSSAVYGDLYDPYTGQRFTVLRYDDGTMVDSSGNVYAETSDGIRQLENKHVYGHIF